MFNEPKTERIQQYFKNKKNVDVIDTERAREFLCEIVGVSGSPKLSSSTMQVLAEQEMLSFYFYKIVTDMYIYLRRYDSLDLNDEFVYFYDIRPIFVVKTSEEVVNTPSHIYYFLDNDEYDEVGICKYCWRLGRLLRNQMGCKPANGREAVCSYHWKNREDNDRLMKGGINCRTLREKYEENEAAFYRLAKCIIFQISKEDQHDWSLFLENNFPKIYNNEYLKGVAQSPESAFLILNDINTYIKLDKKSFKNSYPRLFDREEDWILLMFDRNQKLTSKIVLAVMLLRAESWLTAKGDRRHGGFREKAGRPKRQNR